MQSDKYLEEIDYEYEYMLRIQEENKRENDSFYTRFVINELKLIEDKNRKYTSDEDEINEQLLKAYTDNAYSYNEIHIGHYCSVIQNGDFTILTFKTSFYVFNLYTFALFVKTQIKI